MPRLAAGGGVVANRAVVHRGFNVIEHQSEKRLRT